MHVKWLIAIIAVLVATAWGGKTASAASSVLVEERLLAQQGLWFAFASTALQSQMDVVSYAESGATTCLLLNGGVSAKLVSTTMHGSETKSVVDLYYDTKCKKLFLDAQTEIGGTSPVKATATYFGPTGDKLGALTLSGMITESGVVGIGSFLPAKKGAVPIGVGLACNERPPTGSKTVITCDGGIAQNFPTLNLALGSIATLTLTAEAHRFYASLTFTGSGSLATGDLDKLSVVETSPTTIAIRGAAGAESASTLEGSEAQFALFPPTPTDWTVADKTYHAEFSIHLVSDATQDWTGSITLTSSGMPLATFAVDQSGTGKIDYSDGSEAAITAWTLAD
jgi:hypothetical protein